MQRALAACALVLVGCGGAATPAAVSPEASPPPAPGEPAPEPIGVTSDVPPPPASCAEHASAVPEPKRCTDLRAQLASALASDDAAALAELEACTELPNGLVRALRIELLPVECGDALAEPWLAKAGAAQEHAEVFDALRGLALAAQAHRLVRDPPTLAPPHDKARVQEFVKGALADWIRRQAAAVHRVSLAGSALTGYGMGVVAVEAGLADMRFVEAVRKVPVPDEIAEDPELSEAYYASLDQSLEPRKARGRDAALVGLGRLAEVGVLVDPRLERARKLLSQVYAGRRIDALDALVLPELPAFTPKTPEESIAARAPTFYAPLLAKDLDPTKPAILRALLERGLPASSRAVLGRAQVPGETEALFARGLFELGRTYWKKKAFAQAAELAKRQKQPLLAALSEVLAKGPDNAAAMILGGPHLPSGVVEVAPLDRVAKNERSLAGHAAFDSALLLEIARPADADAKYFEEIAKRYATAETKLPPELRARAKERKEAALATAKAIAKP